MSKIALTPNASGTGTLTIAAPNTSTDRTLTLPDETGTVDTLSRAGNVLQVVTTEKTDTFTTTSSSYVDVTGLSVSITPTSSSSKILVLFQINGSQQVGAGRAYLKLLRDSTVINAGATAGSRTRALGGFSSADTSIPSTPVSGNYLDSPATTSSTTYKIQIAMTAGSGTAYINRTVLDNDGADQLRMASQITVMEIAG